MGNGKRQGDTSGIWTGILNKTKNVGKYYVPSHCILRRPSVCWIGMGQNRLRHFKTHSHCAIISYVVRGPYPALPIAADISRFRMARRESLLPNRTEAWAALPHPAEPALETSKPSQGLAAECRCRSLHPHPAIPHGLPQPLHSGVFVRPQPTAGFCWGPLSLIGRSSLTDLTVGLSCCIPHGGCRAGERRTDTQTSCHAVARHEPSLKLFSVDRVVCRAGCDELKWHGLVL